MSSSATLAQLPSRRRLASGLLVAVSGGVVAGELLSLPTLSVAGRLMLPASLLHVACTAPSAPPLVRFFPTVTVLPYLLCSVPAGFGVRSSSGLPDARDAVEALGIVLVLGALASLAGRMIVELRRSTSRRSAGRAWCSLVGASLAAGAYAAWLWRGGPGLAGAAFTLMSAPAWPWLLASGPRATATGDRPPVSTPLEEVARRIAHAVLKPTTAAAEQLRFVASTLEDAENRAVLENAVQLMGHVQRLVRDLLDLARAQGEPDRRSLEVGRLIDQAAGELRNRHPKAEIECDPVTGHLVADELGLRCLLINLLENAVEARPPGWVHVAAQWSEGWLQIIVEDRAGGVAPEIRDRMFEPFVTTKQRGTGLGLAVVDEVLRSHEGRAAVHPTREGTRFVVTLPKQHPA